VTQPGIVHFSLHINTDAGTVEMQPRQNGPWVATVAHEHAIAQINLARMWQDADVVEAQTRIASLLEINSHLLKMLESKDVFTCRSCGRTEEECSVEPCSEVVAERMN
jgi:hypothetical protein